MKILYVFMTVLVSLFSSHSVTAVRDAFCRSTNNPTGYNNCAHCGPGRGYADNDNTISDITVLHTCGDKNLDRLQCVHQCKCDGKGGLECREWNTCRASTVTNYCKCIYNEATNTCKPNTLNKKTDEGGVCFCPEYGTNGSPPQL